MSSVVANSKEVLAKHGRTFWLASHFLPRSRRDDAAVVYAFCRMVDDIVDEAEAGTPGATIDQALDEVARELAGERRARPLVAAYREVCERLDIPLDAAHELIEGCRSDLRTVRMRTHEHVVRYAYRVAGTVGIMMCGVLGVQDRARALPHAIDLGIAMQLTNISRDVQADAENGRVYLPAVVSVGDPRLPKDTLATKPDAVAKATADLLALAEQYYASARRGFRFIPMPGRVAIAVAAYVYRAIGHRIASRGYVHEAPRAVVPGWQRLIWLAYGVVVACVPVDARRHEDDLHGALRGLPGANCAPRLEAAAQ